MNKTANIAFVTIFLLLLVTFGIWVIARIPDEVSLSERRSLAEMPEMTLDSVKSGEYFTEFEEFLLDQFPMREDFRRLRAITTYYALGKTDNHGIVIENGYAAQLETPLSESAEDKYIMAINTLKESIFAQKDCRIYTSVIPDKMQYVAADGNYPSVSYSTLYDKMKALDFATFIDISDALSMESYYRTDTHWTQDKIVPVADRLLEKMDAACIEDTYIKQELAPFYGVYYGQAALPLNPDTIRILGSFVIDAAKAEMIDPSSGGFVSCNIYETDLISSKEPYDIFFGGGSSIIRIDNTLKDDGKTLYLISDSFGRSLAPLLISDYDEVIIIDSRYIPLNSLRGKLEIKEKSDVLVVFSPLSIRQGILMGS